MKHILILQNKPVCFDLFLRKLPESVVKNYHFHLIIDDRRFPLVEEIEDVIRFRRPSLSYTTYSGTDIIAGLIQAFAMPRWAQEWAFVLKVLLPIHFKKLGQFLFLDDDTIMLQDPISLFDHGFGAAHECFDYHIQKYEAGIYAEIFGNEVSVPEKIFNVGTFIFTTSSADSYAIALRRFFHHEQIAHRFMMNAPLLDEKFLTYWLVKNRASTFRSETVCIVNSALVFRPVMQAPVVFHYAVKDHKIPDYIDWFRLARPIDAEGQIVSYFSHAEDFAARTKRTAVPMYKTIQRPQNPAFALESLFREESR